MSSRRPAGSACALRPASTISVSYHYGFGGQIGAGTIDPASTAPLHAASEITVTGGSGLDGALRQAQAGDTVTVDRFAHLLRGRRGPRAPPGPTGARRAAHRPRPAGGAAGDPARRARARRGCSPAGDGARLILDGLFVSGGDIVLRGPFDHVKIVGCTLDPGTADGGVIRDAASTAGGGRASRAREAASRCPAGWPVG